MTSQFDYYLPQGGPALKACQGFVDLSVLRWNARSRLVQDQGAIAATMIDGQWGLCFENHPGPGWKLVAQSGPVRSYLPDPKTEPGRAILDELENLSPPTPADLAGLLGLPFDDPHQPTIIRTVGLGLVIRLVRQPQDFMVCPLPEEVRPLTEAEFFADRLEDKRRMAS